MDGCKGHILPAVSDRLSQSFDYRKIHMNAESMAKFAIAFADESAGDEVYLPLCHTVLSELYGAEVNLGNWDNGPRVIKSARNGGLKGGYDTDSNTGGGCPTDRRMLVWEAIRIVSNEDRRVTLVLEGPLTVLTNIIGFENTIRRFKQHPKAVMDLMDSLLYDLECYMERAISSGAQAISFADPVASIQILGPRFFKTLAEPCHGKMAVFLKRAAQKGIRIHVCPMLKKDFCAYQTEDFTARCR